MGNVPRLPSFFGGPEPSTLQGPTHGTDDTALSPSNPPLTLPGVGTYNHSVGIALEKAKENWANSNAATKEHPFWANGINPEKAGKGEFTTGDTHVTWEVENEQRHMHSRKEGPEGTTYAGLDDERRPDGRMITNCYLVPPTNVGSGNQSVGVSWQGGYIPNVDLPYSVYKPDMINLIVPSATLDAYFNRPPSSTINADGSLNFEKLNVAMPILKRLGARSDEAPETFTSDWFKP
jgi:hypothetical protein